MPYKIDTDKVRLPRNKDRRIKLTDEDRKEIRELHKLWVSQSALARQYDVSRRLISFVVYPERYEKAKAQFRERQQTWRYYNKEKNTKAVRKTRRYRQRVLGST